jgi:hypothetical protein
MSEPDDGMSRRRFLDKTAKAGMTIHNFGGMVSNFRCPVAPGRPVLGSRFRDVEKILKKFRPRGYEIVSQNPVVDLIADPKTGALNPEILDERIISCVIEFIAPEATVHDVMALVHELSFEVESVFSVSIALPAGMQGESRFEELLATGVYHLPNRKVNIGAAENIAKGWA